ncbi:MAG TPA: protein translocase subunit SecD, partial [Thermoanaerobaculia bacterium]
MAVLAIFTAAIIPTKNDPEPIKRGLDLKGGVQLVMRVNVNEAARLEVDQAAEALKAQATKLNLPVPVTRRVSDVAFDAVPPAGVSTAEYERIGRDFLPTFDVSRQGNGLRYAMKSTAYSDLRRDTVSQAIETIDNRVNALGVSEPIIAPQGEDRIVMQLPGVDDPARLKDIIKTTAQLQFRIVEGSAGQSAQEVFDRLPANLRSEVDIFPSTREDEFGRATGTEFLAVRKNVQVSGRDLKTARVEKGPVGEPVIGFTLTPEGAPKFSALTGANIQRRLAIVLDNKIVSAPTIQSEISDQGQITGQFTQQSASDLALVLRSGALPASLTTLEERTVGPSLGRDSIRQGFMATAIGFGLLVLAIIAYYKGAGVNAVLALLLNLVILLGMMAYFDA